MKKLMRVLSVLFSLCSTGLILATAGLLFIMWTYGSSLPDYRQLATYEPPVTTRFYAGDGRLLTEYAVEKRVFIPLSSVPKSLVDAFLAAEDANFYVHPGIDFKGLARAMIKNVRTALAGGRHFEGASTITQQVAKNFLLTNERSVKRKIKEAMLAFRIEKAYSKDHILELYMNEIYLGYSSYGVGSAAQNYFSKSLEELTVSECAFLAALPKAPNNYDPVRRRHEALERRNWVLSRMLETERITPAVYEEALATDIVVNRPKTDMAQDSEYFSEEVRKEVVSKYGEASLYKGGLAIRTTLDPTYQKIAVSALRDGLMTYDRNHGWRGAMSNYPLSDEAVEASLNFEITAPPGGLPPQAEDVPLSPEAGAAAVQAGEDERPVAPVDETLEAAGLLPMTPQADPIPAPVIPWADPLEQTFLPSYLPKEWLPAIVLKLEADKAVVGLKDGKKGQIPLVELLWAQRTMPGQTLGPVVTAPDQVLAVGDVVWVEHLEKDGAGKPQPSDDIYALRQIPQVEGALIAMDPHTGRVLSLIGGFSFKRSQFNRAIQAWRQPGSSFKPFVYLAALDEGYTPSTLILDAPYVLDQGPGQPKWKPKNYSNIFYGPTTLRIGLERSRNLMTVRLAEVLGVEKIAEYGKKFGINDNFPRGMAISLGSTETTLLRLTRAYAMIVNGGKKIAPFLVDRIQDRKGTTIYKRDDRSCSGCQNVDWVGQSMPDIQDTREQIADPITTYQITSLLNGVMERGTGYSSRIPRRIIGGKTGTSDSNMDAWFIGFSPDLVVAVFVGFDEPRTLGVKDTGGIVAGPIFKKFMTEALKKQPNIPFRVPPGIRFVRVSPKTGLPAQHGEKPVIVEAFRETTDLSKPTPVIGQEQKSEENIEDVLSGGGIY